MNGNIKWYVQDKNSNKKNSAVQKNGAYIEITYKYLHKIDYQRNKSKMPHEGGIENYKLLKKSYIYENNILALIDISSEENIQDSKMTQVEK